MDFTPYLNKPQILRDETYDLVLLDMIMEPGMDGLETYRRIIKMRPDQKVILISGYADADRVRKMQALGLNTYIKKPYLLNALANSLNTIFH